MSETRGLSIPASWEYLMPRRKDRMAGYIRESDPGLADSETMESQAKAVRLYGERQGYVYTLDHEYREAISAYSTTYTSRKRLMDMLRAAERHEFDVLVLTEVRALGRKQAEIFVVYDLLQKCGVRIETISEKFEDSQMGKIVFGLRAAFSEIERDQMVMRCERGKADRIANGNLPGHGTPPYGFVYIDTERETSARLALNETIVHVDPEGNEWSAVTVVRFIFESIFKGISIIQTAKTLTRMGIPTPRRGKWWHTGTIYRILTNPLYMGEAVVNRWKKERDEKTMKLRTTRKSKEEHIILEAGIVPLIVSREMFRAVQEQLEINKQESMRNNQAPKSDLGILRAGFCHCGVCGRTMNFRYPINHQKPYYRCQKRTGREEYINNHDIFILASRIDAVAWEKIKETVSHPELVRASIEVFRRENKLIIGREEIEANIARLKQQMDNLFKLAQNATDDGTIDRLTVMLKQLEKEKREAEGLLYDIEEDEEENEKTEAEIKKFEEWAEQVRPTLTDPNYHPTYEEGRLAIRIIGIHVTVTPKNPADGNTKDRSFDIEVTTAPPKIMETLKGRGTIVFPAS